MNASDFSVTLYLLSVPSLASPALAFASPAAADPADDAARRFCPMVEFARNAWVLSKFWVVGAAAAFGGGREGAATPFAATEEAEAAEGRAEDVESLGGRAGGRDAMLEEMLERMLSNSRSSALSSSQLSEFDEREKLAAAMLRLSAKDCEEEEEDDDDEEEAFP